MDSFLQEKTRFFVASLLRMTQRCLFWAASLPNSPKTVIYRVSSLTEAEPIVASSCKSGYNKPGGGRNVYKQILVSPNVTSRR
jgi:hypothetical protein